MGVKQLWNILEPVKRPGDVSVMKGKTICVDMSIWIVEAQSAKVLKDNVCKPHLRNLFFRTWNLTRAGVNLVFVLDGEPPRVKWDTIMKRTQARNHGQGKAQQRAPRQVRRSLFRIWVNECIALLELLGVPYIESSGEAEALCAWMNARGIVDGCITDDGDFFLYGGRTVYKDFSVEEKNSSLQCYNMDDIEAQLGLTRRSLISLAILLGCDYLPQGVPGVGKEIGLKLVKDLQETDMLDRFEKWHRIQDSELSKTEAMIRKKALKVPGFPDKEVITEFLSPKLHVTTGDITISKEYKCPDLKGLQAFCSKHLEWTDDYILKKTLPLVTYWQMNRLLVDRTCTHSNLTAIPERIVKSRVRNTVECYEVLWNMNDFSTCSAAFTTLETRHLFHKVYPDVVETFLSQVKTKTKQAKKKGKTVDTDEDLEQLCGDLDDLSLASQQPLLAAAKHTQLTYNEEIRCNDADTNRTCRQEDDDDGCVAYIAANGYNTQNRTQLTDMVDLTQEEEVMSRKATKPQKKIQKKVTHQKKATREQIAYPYLSSSDSEIDYWDEDNVPGPTATVRNRTSSIKPYHEVRQMQKIDAVPPVVEASSKCNDDPCLPVADRHLTVDSLPSDMELPATDRHTSSTLRDIQNQASDEEVFEEVEPGNVHHTQEVTSQSLQPETDQTFDNDDKKQDNVESTPDEIVMPLSLSERLGRRFLGQRNVLNALRTLST